MKQPKVFAPDIPPPAPPLPTGPRYRYFSTPPTSVTVKLGDLVGQIPETARTPLFDPTREVEVPADRVLKGPVPRIMLSELAEIVPDALKNAGDTPLRLPVVRLAVAYKFVQSQELIEDKPLPPLEPLISSEGSFIPEGMSEEDFAPRSLPVAVENAASVDLPAAAAEVTAPDPLPPQTENLPSSIPSEQTKPQGKKIFSLLPMFRRKEAAENPPSAHVPPPAPAAQEPRPRVEIPRPRTTLPPITARVAEAAPQHPPTPPTPPPLREDLAPIEAEDLVEQVEPLQAEVSEHVEIQESPESPKEDFSPQPSSAPLAARLLETEHLPKSHRSPEIPEQEGLQSVFLTEEYLSVERVIELSGGLPGIKSCVLSQGRSVLASHNVPESIDLVSLSANAIEMLHAMRQSAAKMGVGAIPAVTIHSDKGPITFFHQEDICLLVMHKDRGFVPGVREKLQAVVRELSRANLTLPATPARPSLGE